LELLVVYLEIMQEDLRRAVEMEDFSEDWQTD
jgi:hypothetical protein